MSKTGSQVESVPHRSRFRSWFQPSRWKTLLEYFRGDVWFELADGLQVSSPDRSRKNDCDGLRQFTVLGEHYVVESWDDFLKRHAAMLWQIDFTVKRKWTLTGLVDLYLLDGIHLGTRPMWISSCTTNPDAAWVEQQARNFLMDADDWNLTPTIVMRDNDGKFQGGFDRVFEGSKIEVHRSVPMAPNLRAHVERGIQTLKHECLDHFVVVSENHLNGITREFQAWYNGERPHSAVGHLPPGDDGRELLTEGAVVCDTRLGGLLRSYRRAS